MAMYAFIFPETFFTSTNTTSYHNHNNQCYSALSTAVKHAVH